MKSLETALEVLKTFICKNGDLSVAEVVAGTGLNKSHVSKILSACRQTGLLVQDPVTRRYSVGATAFELGARYAAEQPIAREALPVMRHLVERCGHSATLSILHEDHVLHIMAVEGPLYIDGRWRVGCRLPIHATASGKVLISWIDEEKLAAFVGSLSLEKITPRTITDPRQLLKEAAKVKSSGFAVTRGESAPGLAAVAVPVFDGEDHSVAALGLVIPDQVFEGVEISKLRDDLFDTARSLSLKLGASTYPFGGGLRASAGSEGARKTRGKSRAGQRISGRAIRQKLPNEETYR